MQSYIWIPQINTDSDSTQPGISLDSNDSNRKLTDDVTGNHSLYIHIHSVIH